MILCLSCKKTFTATASFQCPHCKKSPQIIDGYPAFAPQSAHPGEGFRTECYEGSFDLEAKNFWFKSRKILLRWAFGRYFPKTESYLEAGCGTGYFLEDFESAFPNLSISGCDIFIEGLKKASLRIKRTRLMQMDLLEMPFSEEFDCIGAYDVLEHIPKDATVLEQFFLSVKKGGGIIIAVPQYESMRTWIDDALCHVRRYDAADLRTKAERAGFSIVRQTSFVSLLFPLMVIQRIFHKIFPPKKLSPSVDLKVNPVLNIFFQGVMALERMLIRAGISFPFGGSILLVAIKKD